MSPSTTPFCPFKFFAGKFAQWTAHFTRMYGLEDEVFDYDKRTILIDPGADGEAWALAHAAAHLELDHQNSGRRDFTADQEAAADALAEAWLWDGSFPFTEIPVDGPPTLTTL